MKTTTLELEEEQIRQNSPGVEVPVETPDREEIARKAYECWMERGCPEGSSEEDWYRAERELRSRA